MSKHIPSPSRRRLLRGLATGAALTVLPPWFVKETRAQNAETQTGKPRKFGPNDTIHVGVIGLGGSTPGSFHQGLNDAHSVASQKGTKIVAVCDVDAKHLAEGQRAFGPDTQKFVDYRDLLARPDIDAVIIGAPDHWHALMAVGAMQAGKEVYCEKPMTLTLAEGRWMAQTAKQTGRVFQNGSQQRSDNRFRMACELVRNGRIGKIKRVEAHLPGARSGGPFSVKPVPRGFFYDMWLGPAPVADYLPERTHGSFRYWYEYAGGMVTDWGAHHLDIAQWGLGRDNSGPVKVESTGVAPPNDPTNHSYNVHTNFDITYTYDDGVTLLCTSSGENGVRFEGENGQWIFVSRDKIMASDQKLLDEPLPNDRAVKLYVSNNHAANWVDCIRSRQTPICDAEIGHRSASVCHIGNLSLRLNKPLDWNPQTETFAQADANQMRSRPHRGGWA